MNVRFFVPCMKCVMKIMRRASASPSQVTTVFADIVNSVVRKKSSFSCPVLFITALTNLETLLRRRARANYFGKKAACWLANSAICCLLGR